MLVKTCVGNHDKSTPHRSDTNGIAENAFRRVKDSTSALMRSCRKVVGKSRGMLVLFAYESNWQTDSYHMK